MYEPTEQQRIEYLLRTAITEAWVKLKTVELMRAGVAELEAQNRAGRECADRQRADQLKALGAELASWLPQSP